MVMENKREKMSELNCMMSRRQAKAEKQEEKKTKRNRNDEANLRKPERGW
jgi:hypothetical protein